MKEVITLTINKNSSLSPFAFKAFFERNPHIRSLTLLNSTWDLSTKSDFSDSLSRAKNLIELNLSQWELIPEDLIEQINEMTTLKKLVISYLSGTATNERALKKLVRYALLLIFFLIFY